MDRNNENTTWSLYWSVLCRYGTGSVSRSKPSVAMGKWAHFSKNVCSYTYPFPPYLGSILKKCNSLQLRKIWPPALLLVNKLRLNLEVVGKTIKKHQIKIKKKKKVRMERFIPQNSEIINSYIELFIFFTEWVLYCFSSMHRGTALLLRHGDGSQTLICIVSALQMCHVQSVHH